MNVKFGPDGLVPAVVQDDATGEVLMLGYMNEEALRLTLKEGRVCFFSRSRKTLWRKGDTSGVRFELVGASLDCDGDALLVRVNPTGPACHTGRRTCFHNEVSLEGGAGQASEEPEGSDLLLELSSLIRSRKVRPRPGSYTSSLFEKGPDHLLKKVGEEAAEFVMAARLGEREHAIKEAADLFFHALVGLETVDAGAREVLRELADRRSRPSRGG